VLAMTLDKARARGLSVHVLPTRFDVDTEADYGYPNADTRRAAITSAHACPRAATV
jgi:hypothetical protein